jgi:hypothetical protein
VEFFDLSAAYDAWTGTPVVGNKAWLRLTPVNSDGLTGSPLIVQTIVATTQALAAAVLTSPLAAHFLATYSTSPTNLSLIVQGALAPAGPWTQVSITAATTSPQSIAATTGQYRRVVLVNTVTGDMSPYSNAILVT